ncbi:MAG: transglycosylase SLT domain-containing protein [Mycobacteriaceae bacterium]
MFDQTHNSSHGLSLEGDHLAVIVGTKLRDAWKVLQPIVTGFRDIIKDLWSWFKEKLLPAIMAYENTVLPALMSLVKSVTKTMHDHRDIIDAVRTAFKFLGDFLTTILIPLLGAIVHDLLDLLGPAFRLVATIIGSILIPALKFLLTIAVNVLGGIIDAAAKAFGWVPVIGKQLRDGAKHFDKFRDDVNSAFNGINSKTVSVGVNFRSTTLANGNVKVVGGTQLKALGGRIIGPGTGTSDSIPAMLSNGEHVLTAREVAAAGGHSVIESFRKSLVRGYANGGVVVDPRLPSAAQINSATSSSVQGLANRMGSSLLGLMGGSGGGGAQQWAALGAQVLQMLGRPLTELGALLRRINFESGGNPNAINLTDSNAKAGHPSQGLMQVIAGTFARYAGPFAGMGLTNPFANVYAGANYAVHAYGSVAAIDPLVRPMGYDTGGLLGPGMTGRNYGKMPERVLSGQQTKAFDRLVDRLTGEEAIRLHPADLQALAVAISHVQLDATISAGSVDRALGRSLR